MSVAQPLERIRSTHRDVECDRVEVERWPQKVLQFIANANARFKAILDVDAEVQAGVFATGAGIELQDALRNLLRDWLDTSELTLRHAERLCEFGVVEGADELKRHIEQARSILTPDDVYFNDDKLWAARDEAIKSRCAGLTEPLIDDEGHD